MIVAEERLEVLSDATRDAESWDWSGTEDNS
jgi:hypothetical protein